MNRWNLKLKTIPFTLAPSKIKYFGINLTKYIQDLYEENYKTLINEIKKELNKWRDIPMFMDKKILSRCPFFPT